MGSILKASCQCGYEVPDIYAGVGLMSGFSTCNLPAFCPKCKDVVVGNYLKKSARCPECYGILVYYNHPSLRKDVTVSNIVFDWGRSPLGDEKDFILYDIDYLCPKCGKMKLRFSDLGTWD